MKQSKIPSNLLNDSDSSPTEATLIHAYPGSMPAYLASRLVERYSNKGDLVFDPFCGSGAVLIEAAKIQRCVFGCDLLKIPIDIASTAFSLPNPSAISEQWAETRKNSLDQAYLFASNRSDRTYESEHHANLKQWLHGETFDEVMLLFDEFENISNATRKKLFQLILSGSLISLSKRVSRGVLHWGWIADNVKPNKDDLLKVDVFAEIDKRVNRLVDFMKATGSFNLLSKSNWEVIQHDWMTKELPRELEAQTVDLYITSPPYPYSIDYALSLRLANYLLGIPFENSRKQEIGARFKRKRVSRSLEYSKELMRALATSSAAVKIGGKAVFVMHHPDEYRSVIDVSIEGWLSMINENLFGCWKLIEVGYRDCVQRRVVHKSRANRMEVVAAFERIS